jgi:hypothetical protein
MTRSAIGCPRLIVATELGSRHAPAAARRTYQTLRSLTYHCTTTTLRRVGEAELAWIAADRSLAAAEEAGRPLLVAVSAYRLGYVLIRLRETERALHLVLQAAESLRRVPRSLPVLGALYLVAVTAAAADYDQSGVQSFLTQARQAAEMIGGTVTTSGPPSGLPTWPFTRCLRRSSSATSAERSTRGSL